MRAISSKVLFRRFVPYVHLTWRGTGSMTIGDALLRQPEGGPRRSPSHGGSAQRRPCHRALARGRRTSMKLGRFPWLIGLVAVASVVGAQPASAQTFTFTVVGNARQFDNVLRLTRAVNNQDGAGWSI